MGRETEFFVEGERGLLPLLRRNDGGEGRGKEAFFIGKPLSFTLPARASPPLLGSFAAVLDLWSRRSGALADAVATELSAKADRREGIHAR